MRITNFVLGPVLVLSMACGKDDDRPIDEALSRDLSLAGQQYQPQQFVSPAEQAYGGYAPQYAPAAYAQPQRSAPVARRPVARTASSSTVYNGGSSSQGRVIEEKHTKRDAAIGAAAGAVIGATTSRDKLKGAIIGGAAGAILGGVIGNNVDITRRRVPQ